MRVLLGWQLRHPSSFPSRGRVPQALAPSSAPAFTVGMFTFLFSKQVLIPGFDD